MTRKQTTKRTPATGKGTGTRTGGCKRASAAAKNGKATVQKSGFDVKGTYGKAAKPAVGTREERIRRITALGLSREAAVKAINAEEAYRARERRMQAAMPKKQTAANRKETYTVWDSKTGKTFATSDEAIAYANERMRRTGEILAITQTNRKATHKYGKKNDPRAPGRRLSLLISHFRRRKGASG